ncbi:hypothetical protein MOO46_07715 (plasmid) [Apilactobacillus apisilvae]|uniref:Uncharacterized protein n=1 Tax=Apilactobacillus apisilvae TaxID=2923364 RepID=A0ABY4PK02_9LACO|nr:DUF5336 domain-containing protein [Apilactobacillus apisilvae]UQS85867.1 hypothetical protein MOO46_07715 [Apilactobacillus apisilvae]
MPAIAVMGGMIVGLGLLAAVVAIGGSAMITGSVGFIIFGAAVALVGAGVWLATEGTAALDSQLPNLANNGLAGAGALVVLGAALLAFSVFALVSAVGLAVLGVGLVVLGAGALVAGAGVLVLAAAGMVLAAALVGVGGGLMVAAAGIQAMKSAISGDFGGAKDAIESTKDSVSGLKDTIGNIGKGAMNGVDFSSMFGGITASADSTKNHVDQTKMSPQMDLSKVNNQMNGLGNKKFDSPKMKPMQLPNSQNVFEQLNKSSQNNSVPVQVKPKADTGNQDWMSNIKSQIGNQQLPGMKMGKIKMDGSNQDVMSSLQSQMSNKTMTPPKVGTPKVPNPKMPTKLGTIAAPKVARPTVPQPKLPHLVTIPAPKVHNPNMSPLVQAVQSGMQKAVGTVRNASSSMYSAGAYVGQGLASGIRSQIGNVASAANSLIAQADRAARAKAKIHSPSRLFAEIGDYLGQGMANGMNGTQNLISDASGNMNDAAQGGINDLDVNANVNSKKNNTPSDFFGYGMSGNADNSSHYQNNSVNNQSSSHDQSKNLNFAKGAIQIINNEKGKSAEDLLAEIEDLIIKQNEGGLANG